MNFLWGGAVLVILGPIWVIAEFLWPNKNAHHTIAIGGVTCAMGVIATIFLRFAATQDSKEEKLYAFMADNSLWILSIYFILGATTILIGVLRLRSSSLGQSQDEA